MKDILACVQGQRQSDEYSSILCFHAPGKGQKCNQAAWHRNCRIFPGIAPVICVKENAMADQNNRGGKKKGAQDPERRDEHQKVEENRDRPEKGQPGGPSERAGRTRPEHKK
jgi:hypothetical protein